MKKKQSGKLLILSVVLVLVYAPILILAVYSVTDATMIGKPGNLSFENYVTLFTTPALREMIVGTLLLAVGAAILATLLGTAGAIGAFYSKKRTQAVYAAVNEIPVVNADVVTGFSICILTVVVLGMDKESYLPLIAGHVTLCAPFVYLSVFPKLTQMDSSLYEAALDLGATPMGALYRVVIPEIMPGIISGFAMAITLSLDDYFIATYTKPATFDTISTYVVNATKGSQTSIKTALWALSTLIFVIVVVLALLSSRKPSGEKARKEAA